MFHSHSEPLIMYLTIKYSDIASAEENAMNKRIITTLLFSFALIITSCDFLPNSSFSSSDIGSNTSSTSEVSSSSVEPSSSIEPSSSSIIPSSSSNKPSSSIYSSSSKKSSSTSYDPNVDPDDLWQENDQNEEGYDTNLPTKSGPQYEKYSYRPVIETQIPEITISLSYDPSFGRIPNMSETYLTTAARLNKGDYYGCTVTVSNYDGEDLGIVDKNCEIKVRGNYTANYAKKPFRLKFENKTPMPGFDGSFKNWVLLAEVKDQSLQRNSYAFYLSKLLLESEGLYVSDFRPVELYFIDGTGSRQYWGSYILAEQQEVKSDRIDITDISDMPSEDGIEGNYTGTDIGYFFEYDAYYHEEGPSGDPNFTMNYFNNSFRRFNSTSYSNPTQTGYTIKSNLSGKDKTKQLSFIKSYMENVYQILYRATYNDQAYVFNDTFTAISPSNSLTPREAIGRVIDINSLVGTYIYSEVVCDPDIDWSSFYMDVDFGPTAKDNLLRFEAPWDFDSCFAVRRDYPTSPTGYYAAYAINPWLGVIVNNDWFMDLVKDKYRDLYKYDLLKDTVDFLENTANNPIYETMYVRNIQRWGANDMTGEVRNELRNFTSQKQHSNWLRNWILTRLNWLSNEWLDGYNVVTHEKLSPGQLGDLSIGNIALKTNGTKYRYEAEDAVYESPIAVRVNRPETNASNDSYLGDISQNIGKTITFKVTATQRKQCYLVAAVAAKGSDIPFSDMFIITVNNHPLNHRNIVIPGVPNYTWHDWVEVDIYSFWMEAGENTIVFTSGSNSTNFDYIDLYSKDILTF